MPPGPLPSPNFGRGEGGRGRGEGFWIARYPVTNAQFALFIAAGGYEERGRRWWSDEGWKWRKKGGRRWSERGTDQPEYWDDPRFSKSRRGYPVVGVSWYEAAAYCAWLTEQLHASRFTFQVWRDGTLETLSLESGILTVRLPTEEEWVATAGGAEGERYPWDPLPPHAGVGGWHESHANTAESGIGGTTPVAMYPSGQSHGVWDLGGNVWEWMASEEAVKPLRGGSWDLDRRLARVYERFWNRPGYSHHFLGFRLLASPAGSEF